MKMAASREAVTLPRVPCWWQGWKSLALAPLAHCPCSAVPGRLGECQQWSDPENSNYKARGRRGRQPSASPLDHLPPCLSRGTALPESKHISAEGPRSNHTCVNLLFKCHNRERRDKGKVLWMGGRVSECSWEGIFLPLGRRRERRKKKVTRQEVSN